MATAAANGGGASVCANAEEYVLDRLEGAGEPMSPSELADEYGCGAGHMRSVLSRLQNEGELARPARGKYELAGESVGPDTGDTENGELPFPQEDEEESMESPGVDTNDNAPDGTSAHDGDTNDSAGDSTGAHDGSTEDSTSDSTSSQGVESVGTAPAAAAATGAIGATAAAANEDGVDGRVVVAGLAVLVVGYLLYRRATESGGGQDESSSSPSAEQSEQTQMAGGLAQGGA